MVERSVSKSKIVNVSVKQTITINVFTVDGF